MPQRPKIVFFSDIHIGTNAVTNGYQRSLHMSGPGRIATPAA